jgi:hypothetical protein
MDGSQSLSVRYDEETNPCFYQEVSLPVLFYFTLKLYRQFAFTLSYLEHIIHFPSPNRFYEYTRHYFMLHANFGSFTNYVILSLV